VLNLYSSNIRLFKCGIIVNYIIINLLNISLFTSNSSSQQIQGVQEGWVQIKCKLIKNKKCTKKVLFIFSLQTLENYLLKPMLLK